MNRIAWYSLGAAMLALAGLVALLSNLPSVATADLEALDPTTLSALFVRTASVMFAAGMLGSCLYNFRGLSKHSAAGSYDRKYNLSYYLRPVAGGISGFIVFFLLLGGALALNVGTATSGTAWATFLGRMPYIAFSLLAGYGSHEFMLKLKDVADSVFALRGNHTRKRSATPSSTTGSDDTDAT